jgi:hypothetical protein
MIYTSPLIVIIIFGLISVNGSCGYGCSRDMPREMRGIDRIVEDGSLIGLSRNAVIMRFGDPKTDGRFGRPDWYYYAGPDAGCIDSRWLLIYFDDRGEVEDARITND